MKTHADLPFTNPNTNLKFNVAQLLREEIGARRSYHFCGEQLRLDHTLVLREVCGTVQFTHTTNGVFVQVQATGLVRLTCVRSLEEFDQRIDLEVSDEFHSVIDIFSAESLPRPTEEDPFFLDAFHVADIGEYIREYALLEIPMNPVCEACRHRPFPPYSSEYSEDEHAAGDAGSVQQIAPHRADHRDASTEVSELDEEVPAVIDPRLEVLKRWRRA